MSESVRRVKPQIQQLLELRASVLVDNYWDYLSSLPIKRYGKGTTVSPYRMLLLNITKNES